MNIEAFLDNPQNWQNGIHDIVAEFDRQFHDNIQGFLNENRQLAPQVPIFNPEPAYKKAILHTSDIVHARVVVPQLSIGNRTATCNFCHAKLWPQELSHTTICCANGKVSLPDWQGTQNEAAQWIFNLWKDQSPKGKTFRKYARSTNNAFSLASQIVNHVSNHVVCNIMPSTLPNF
jgi:hypothetical protein